MKFINREAEMDELKKLEKLSKKKFFIATIYGMRRVGKTRLILEFIKDNGLYFFVNKNKTSDSLLQEFETILKNKKIINNLEKIESWDLFFETIAKRFSGVAVFDEFQNFYSVEPSVMGILQKTADLNEDRPCFIILSGSIIGLLKKSFQDRKEPLYGRVKKSMKLEPLNFKHIMEISRLLKLSKEDAVKAYSIFGGYPKYYVSIEDFDLSGKPFEKIMEEFFFIPNAAMEEEIKLILSQEFGRRSGTYYSILEAVATGNNTISSVASYLNKPVPSITRHVDELKNYFEIIYLAEPFQGKRGIYEIKHPLIRFWFAYIYKNYSEYSKKSPDFIKKVKTDLNSVYGRCFESICSEFISDKLGLENAKRQWGKIPDAEKGKNEYEIDLVGTRGSKTYFFEFKWKELDLKEAKKILNRLKEKSRFVETGLSLEYGLIAKKIKEKKKLRKEIPLLYDLDDILPAQ